MSLSKRADQSSCRHEFCYSWHKRRLINRDVSEGDGANHHTVIISVPLGTCADPSFFWISDDEKRKSVHFNHKSTHCGARSEGSDCFWVEKTKIDWIILCNIQKIIFNQIILCNIQRKKVDWIILCNIQRIARSRVDVRSCQIHTSRWVCTWDQMLCSTNLENNLRWA